MFNPFAPFDPHFLNAFRQKGVKAFVKQTYDRGRNMYDNDPQPAFLLIHFTDLANAQKHFDVIKTDHNRQIYNLDDPLHWQELVNMLNRPAGKRFFTNLTIRNVNQRAKQLLDRRIRDYLRQRTNWRPGRNEQVNFSLDFIFGEIYVELSYGPKRIKIKLEELENQPTYVL
jgi:hypothetical protein